MLYNDFKIINIMATGARLRSNSSSSSQRKLSDNVELPKNYPNLSANGISSGTSGRKQLTSVQNLPAVLTDPRKGKNIVKLFPKKFHRISGYIGMIYL